MNPVSEKVSCRNLSWMIDAFSERGLATGQLLEGVSVSAEHLLDASRFIDWKELKAICENFGGYVTDEEIIECGKRSVDHPIFKVFRIPAKLIYEVYDLYGFLIRPEHGLLVRSYPMLTISAIESSKEHIAFDLDVLPPFEPIHEWNLMLVGQLMAMPRILGLQVAEVELTELDQRARFNVRWSSSIRAWLAPIRRALSFPFTARAAARELFSTNEILEDKYRRLRLEMDRRLEAETRLAKQEQHLQLLSEHVRDVIWTVDLDLQFTYVSPSAEEVYGRPISEFTALARGEGMTKESFSSLEAALAEELAADGDSDPTRSRTFEIELIRKDGSIRWIEMNVSFLRDEQGRPNGVVGVSRDLTERRRLAEQLRQAQKMESIGHLAGGVAHDFNNLLVVIQGYTELSLDNPHVPLEVRSHLKEVQEASERAAVMTHQLLAFGRRQQIDRVPIDLSEIVSGLRSMLERLIPEDVVQDFDLESNASIQGDPGQIEQVIVNMAVNARDAMPDGGTLLFETRNVVVNEEICAAHPEAMLGGYTRLRVVDDGCGMTLEVQLRVFDPFYSTKPEGKGTGLGLSVAHGIVSQHGGFLSIESEPGVGTGFSIYLPTADGETISVDDSVDDESIQGGTEAILLVEDEPGVRDLGRQILERAGYTVHCAADGASALELFRENVDRLDLVLLDVVMPTMRGREARERMHDVAPNVPVVFVSGYVGDDARTDFIADQNLELISKPYRKRTLLRKVREVLDREALARSQH